MVLPHEGVVALLEAEGVVKRFGDRAVLDGVDLRVEAGQALLVEGRSGAGKTTLLNVLGGLEVPEEGVVWIDGARWDALGKADRALARRERVGFVFQDFNLIPDLTVFENVLLPLELARRGNRRERAASLLDRFGLGDLARAFPETLSGGERQRVGIARALANEPSVVLADEPTANLDEANARRVFKLLGEAATEDRCVVVASHDPLAAQYLGRGFALKKGRLERARAPARSG